jgi:hypothetical protein
MRPTFFTLAVSLFFLTACTNDEAKGSACQANLPAITTTGANTFGCCINGNLLIPRDGTGTFGVSDDGFKTWGDPTGANAYSEIDIHDYKSDRTASLFIHIQGLHQNGAGNYVIDQSNGATSIDGFFHTYLHCRVFNEATNSYKYYRSSENSGEIKILRYELVPGVRRIVSGTFNCIVRNSSNPNDTIEIKDGRFDINGYTLPNTTFI